ncbi:MAG: hypothetical protein R3F50_15090 [Gammaproteobacteria bacterium]
MHERPALLTLSLAVAILFYALVVFFSQNIPQQDDYDSILYYLLNSSTVLNSALFDVHVSHRLALTRLLAEATTLLGHGVDFRLLVYSGSLCLLGVVFLLFRTIRQREDRALLLALICLSAFSLYHWSNMAWATAAVQNYASLFAALACFYLFNQKTLATTTSAVLLGLAVPYISSNGLLVLPILLCWSAWSSGHLSAATKTSLVLVSSNLFSFCLYFLLLPTDTGKAFDPLPINAELPALIRLVRAYLVICAGYLHFEPLALFAGTFINGYFLLLVRRRYYTRNPVVFFFFSYLMLSMLLIALFRQDLGIRQLIASRYQVYTQLINALIAISFLELGLDRWLLWQGFRKMLLAFFCSIYLASFYYLGNLNSEKNRLESGIADWRNSGSASLYHPDPRRASELLSRSIDAAVYQLPADISQ